MDEETTVQTDVEEASETSSAFDEGWDEVEDVVSVSDGSRDYDVDSEDSDTAEESEEAEADADQQEADDDEGGESAEETKAEGDKGTPYPDVTIKYLSNEEVISGKDVVEYVQKGRDYDRIRERWDGVANDIDRLRMYESFLGKLAQARGGTGNAVKDIEALIDETNTRTLIAEAEARGEDLSPAAAAAMAVRMRTDFVPSANGNSEEARQEKSQRETARFLKEYKDVRAEDIPKEVWDDVNDKDGANGDLLMAYRGYENRKLKEELKALKKDLEDAKQQKKNKARSTGSPKSVGSAATIDPFDAGWDDAL